MWSSFSIRRTRQPHVAAGAPPPHLAAGEPTAARRCGRPPPHFAAGKPQPHIAAGESWRVVPDASAHLLFVTLGKRAGGWTREPSLRVVGARSHYVDTDPTGRTMMLGLRLRPGVLSSLIGTDARCLTDVRRQLKTCSAKRGGICSIRIVATPIPEWAVHDLAAFVVGQISARPRRPTDPTVLAAALSRTASVEAAAEAMGLTPRAVHRGAITGIGLAPKRVVRIQRLHRAFALLLPPRSRSLWRRPRPKRAGADQAHLSRECSEALGRIAGAVSVAWRPKRSRVRCRLRVRSAHEHAHVLPLRRSLA